MFWCKHIVIFIVNRAFLNWKVQDESIVMFNQKGRVKIETFVYP